MASRKKPKQKSTEKCAQFWGILDVGKSEIINSWPCFLWRCPVCGPKREAEAMEMLRLRLEGWQEDLEAAPNFVTLTCDRSKLPDGVKQGTGDEDGYLRARFSGVMRQLNQAEKRAKRLRIQYVGVVERGKRSGNWHLHLVTDREIHVRRWRAVCQAHGLGKVVKAKRLDGARGAAVYLAKYLRKAKLAHSRGRRVLLKSKGCMPSLELWRWRRATGRGYKNASSWTPDLLKRQSAFMRDEKDRYRQELEADTEGPLRVRASHPEPGGGRRVFVNRPLKRKFCSPIPRKQRRQDSSRRPRGGDRTDEPPTQHEASSEPS